jgi:hypothetical protein
VRGDVHGEFGKIAAAAVEHRVDADDRLHMAGTAGKVERGPPTSTVSPGSSNADVAWRPVRRNWSPRSTITSIGAYGEMRTSAPCSHAAVV